MSIYLAPRQAAFMFGTKKVGPIDNLLVIRVKQISQSLVLFSKHITIYNVSGSQASHGGKKSQTPLEKNSLL